MQFDPASVRYAGFWERFFAFVLDNIIVTLLLVPVLFLAFGWDWLLNTALLETPLGYALQLGVVLAYLMLFWKLRSATPGKIMMGMSIVDATTGGKPSTGRLLLRCVGYYVSLLPLLLGFIWAAFDKRKQTFHDKLANTIVIIDRPRPVEDDATP